MAAEVEVEKTQTKAPGLVVEGVSVVKKRKKEEEKTRVL